MEERDKKIRRPRIGENGGPGRDGNNERFEKVDYSQRERPAFDPERRPRVNFNNTDRGNVSRPSYGSDNRRSNYNNDNTQSDNRDGSYGNRSYGERSDRGYNQSPDRPYRPRTNNYDNRGGSYGNNENRSYGNSENRSYGNNENRGYGNNENRGGYNSDRPYRPVVKPGYGNNSGGNSGSRPYNSNRPSNGGGYQQRDRYNSGGSSRPYNNNGGSRYNSGENRPFNKPIRRTDDYDPSAKYSLKKRIQYQEANIDPNEPIRLNKFMANAGVCSRREADEFIQAGVVKVNGEVMTELGTKIHRSDIVMFHDQPVKLEGKIYVLLNKPKDCVTTADDPQGRLTVMDIVRSACTERIYPVGRLDRNTTGVLLLTNDGDLASKLTHPKFIKKKIYHVWTDKDVTEEDMQKIADGIELEDGPIHADAVSYATDIDKNQVGIEIHSGRNRIVRRMFEALGYRVIKLDRVYFAGLTKKNLQRGRWRYLTQPEVNILRMGAFE